MANYLAPIINDQQENSNGAPLSGGTIEVYFAGSSTAVTTYSDQAGLVPNTWPIVLNTLGVNSQGAVWLGGGFAYKFIIKDSTGVVQRTIDNVSGINDAASSGVDQWITFANAPTYVSATSFTVAGDQRQIFQIGRRTKTQNTGGLVYSTITNSTYSAPNTTVTVANDSGVLDAGLSQVSYGIISSINTASPIFLSQQQMASSGSFTVPAGVTRLYISGCGGGGGGGAGGGGGNNITAGGGGGGGGCGAYLIRYPFACTPGVVLSVTIGSAGVGATGTSSTGAAGTNGGNTVITNLSVGTVTLNGGGPGGGGQTNNSAPAAGGVLGVGGSTTGNGTIAGATGCYGIDSIYTASPGGNGGMGASGPYGGGGGGGRGTAGVGGLNGAAGTGYGSGGGGGGGIYASTATVVFGGNGSPGAAGFVLFEW